MKGEHDVLLGDAGGDELVRNSAFDSVVLNPDFVFLQVDVEQAAYECGPGPAIRRTRFHNDR